MPEGDPRTEIGSLGRSLNAMLAQIERAFHAQEASEQAAHQSEERMRRFIADASHELRTPLTTIRGFAAHYRQRGGASRLRPGPTAVRREQDHHPERMRLTPGPARSRWRGAPRTGCRPRNSITSWAGSSPRRRGWACSSRTCSRWPGSTSSGRSTKAPVDLLTLAADAVQDARIVSPGRPIDLVVAPGTAFLVDGDEPRLRQVIGNLVNNAITHTPAGTPVRVKIARGTLEAGVDRPGRERGA